MKGAVHILYNARRVGGGFRFFYMRYNGVGGGWKICYITKKSKIGLAIIMDNIRSSLSTYTQCLQHVDDENFQQKTINSKLQYM